MPEDDFYTPTDLDALRMENELLTFEVRFLKAKYADPERYIAEAIEKSERAKREAKRSMDEFGRKLAEAQETRERLRKRLARTENLAMSPERKARLERAERDLVSLLKSMSGSPLGRLFRLKKAFRELEQRYL
ncbi:MAG: hypothetical protein ACRDSJ_04830 [Rubrobacteraceae bacterium]